MAWRGQDQGISVVLNKRLDLGFAFGLENRTSAIQQSATWFDQGPKRFEQLGLNVGQLRHIGLAAQPTHIGVSPANARRCTGRIQQDAIKQMTIPPFGSVCGICSHNLRLYLQAFKVLLNALTALGVYIQGKYLGCWRTFQQVPSFAAGRCTSIKQTQLCASGLQAF